MKKPKPKLTSQEILALSEKVSELALEVGKHFPNEADNLEFVYEQIYKKYESALKREKKS